MIKAIGLKRDSDIIPMSTEMQRCLYNLCKEESMEMVHGFVQEEVHLVSLTEAINILNGEGTLPEVSQFHFSDQTEQSPIPETTEVEEEAEPAGEYANMNNNQRAAALKGKVKRRLLGDLGVPLRGCRENEVRLSAVHEYWDTGLSKGSLSRHIKSAVQDLRTQGYLIYSSAGRYTLNPNHTPYRSL